MSVTEPMTMLTDYLLATASFCFGLKLFRAAGGRRHTWARLWATGFLCIAGAALAGGTYHGLALEIPSGTRRALWNCTLYLIGLGSGFMISGTLNPAVSWTGTNGRWLRAGLLISLLGLGIQQSQLQIHPHFNHNDLYHCVQIIGLYSFYRAGAGALKNF